MQRWDRVRHLSRRVREVGGPGLRRRLVHPLNDRLRRRAHARWLARFGGRLDGAALARAALGGSAGAAALSALRRRLLQGGFFFDTRNGALREAFRKRCSQELEVLLAQADRTLAEDVSWIGPHATGDWHRALPEGGRWPLEPRERLHLEAARPLGDVRLAWEVGRCPHLVRLSQAAWLTGDARYASAAIALLRSFHEANPPGLGIAWAHAQEVALRGVALLWCFALLRDQPVFDEESFALWLFQILAHGEFVASDLSDHVITHNHLVSELAGLAVLGLSLPELSPAARWRSVGLRLLAREIAKQVDDQGFQGEHSTHYHAFVLDSYLSVLVLAGACGVQLPQAYRQRVAAMLDATAWLLRSDGTLPAIGDTDAGRAWRLGSDPRDRRDVLALGAVAFAAPRWGAIAGDAGGAFWLSGGSAVPGAGDALPPGGCHRLGAAGLAVARTGFGSDAESVVFRAGPTRLLPDVAPSHAHADALSVLWQVRGRDVLVDPGVWIYSATDGWRESMRGTSSHSCVTIDARDQADVTSHRFGVEGLRPSRWLSCSGDAHALCAGAEHPAAGPLRVRRRLAWIAGVGLVLFDEIEGAGDHEVTSWLQLPRGTVSTGDGVALLDLENGLHVRVGVAGDLAGISHHSPSGADPPGPGWRAPRYGERQGGTALALHAGRRPLPCRLLVVLQASLEPPAGGATLSLGSAGSAQVTLAGHGFRFEPGGAVRTERSA